jgi:hypothetical protein
VHIERHADAVPGVHRNDGHDDLGGFFFAKAGNGLLIGFIA